MDGDWIAAETTKKGNSVLSRGAGNEIISSSRIEFPETDEGWMQGGEAGDKKIP